MGINPSRIDSLTRHCASVFCRTQDSTVAENNPLAQSNPLNSFVPPSSRDGGDSATTATSTASPLSVGGFTGLPVPRGGLPVLPSGGSALLAGGREPAVSDEKTEGEEEEKKDAGKSLMMIRCC